MHPMLTIAIRAARQAGDFFAKNYEKNNSIEIIKNNQINLVTNFDKTAEQMIITIIQKSYPFHTIITEESGQILGTRNDIQWIIDPLDGSINFIKRLPHFAVSISVRINDRTEIAVIYNPMLNELFTAVRGQGAQLNGYRLRLKNNNELQGAIIATNFPFKTKKYSITYINIIDKLARQCLDFRYTGVSSLDLAYVAAGRIDVLFDTGLMPWECIAGDLLIRESGGVVSDFVGGHNYLSSGNILAGSLRIVKKIALNMQTELSEILKC